MDGEAEAVDGRVSGVEERGQELDGEEANRKVTGGKGI